MDDKATLRNLTEYGGRTGVQLQRAANDGWVVTTDDLARGVRYTFAYTTSAEMLAALTEALNSEAAA